MTAFEYIQYLRRKLDKTGETYKVCERFDDDAVLIEKLQNENAELKAENKELYKENTTLIAGSILEKQNIVKDTAKEIWNDITSYYFSLRVLGNATVELDKLAEFWHKRGVDVE